jgi:hypothetical protein
MGSVLARVENELESLSFPVICASEGAYGSADVAAMAHGQILRDPVASHYGSGADKPSERLLSRVVLRQHS